MKRGTTFGLAGAILLADRLTKLWIERSVSAFETIPIVPGIFNIVHVQNRGAAFGIMNESDSDIRSAFLIGVSGAVLLFLIYGLFRPSRLGLDGRTWLLAALGMIVGGAAGNLYDRLVFGSVTDFLQVFLGTYEFPSFNVADSAITVGCLVILAESFLRRPERKESR